MPNSKEEVMLQMKNKKSNSKIVGNTERKNRLVQLLNYHQGRQVSE